MQQSVGLAPSPQYRPFQRAQPYTGRLHSWRSGAPSFPLGHKGHSCPHTEPWVRDSGVAPGLRIPLNRPRDKDPGACVFDSHPRNHWEVSLGKE